jgi:hypothetical protein
MEWVKQCNVATWKITKIALVRVLRLASRHFWRTLGSVIAAAPSRAAIPVNPRGEL